MNSSSYFQSFKSKNNDKKSTKEKRRFMRRASMCEEEGNHTKTTTKGLTIPRRYSCSSKPTMTTKNLHLVPKHSANEGIVEKFIECINNQDVDGCIALLKSPQQCEWRFSGEVNINMKDYGGMIQKIVRSFPDFAIDCNEVVEVGPGVVQVRQAVASGTHTGEPFGFQCYHLLPATGLKCVNDPEHLTFFIIDGKIVQVHVICTGELCGPVGLHKQSKTGAGASSTPLRRSSSSSSSSSCSRSGMAATAA